MRTKTFNLLSMVSMKNDSRSMHGVFLLFMIAVLGLALPQLRSGEPNADPEQRGQTSYMPVDIKESFSSIMSRMLAAKPDIEKEHTDLLRSEERRVGKECR